jgi:hypothetical protein
VLCGGCHTCTTAPRHDATRRQFGVSCSKNADADRVVTGDAAGKATVATLDLWCGSSEWCSRGGAGEGARRKHVRKGQRMTRGLQGPARCACGVPVIWAAGPRLR